MDIGDFGFWISGILDFGDFGFWSPNPKSKIPQSKIQNPNFFGRFWGFGILDLDRYVAILYVAPNFGDFGCWILDFGGFGFWGFGSLDFGFWGFWILDLGDLGFWILDIGDFGFWILGILDFDFGILDFGFWTGM